MFLFTFPSLLGASSPFRSQDNLVLVPEDSERLSPYRHGYDVGYYSLADSINSFFFFSCSIQSDAGPRRVHFSSLGK